MCKALFYILVCSFVCLLILSFRTTPTLSGVSSKDVDEMSPSERACQKGPDAAMASMTALFDGTPVCGGNAAVIIADLTPNVAVDWGHAVFTMMKKHAIDISNPNVSYLAWFQDEGTRKTCNMILEKRLLDEWWHTRPEAGSAEPQDEPLVPTPSLAVSSWVNGKIIIPDVLRDKFDNEHNGAFMQGWRKLCDDFTERHNVEIVLRELKDKVQRVDNLTGPDVSIMPPAPMPALTLTQVKVADFKHDDLRGPQLLCTGVAALLWELCVHSACLILRVGFPSVCFAA